MVKVRVPSTVLSISMPLYPEAMKYNGKNPKTESGEVVKACLW